ncbi:MAG: glycosyltransferase family 4 protein [Desulfovibrionaceae bacterium]|jgi:glycosyltransferase involved in cell wall biosynthesis|nr:glycosyltransferase family 4 protein [Desulfovibrionaceae bacterium]
MRNNRIWATLDPFYEDGEIMGRSVANQGFLDALLRLDPFDAYHFFLPDTGAAEALRRAIAQRHPGFDATRIGAFSRLELPRKLAEGGHHCFHLSDCVNHPPHLARLRNALAPEIFPITSVTHSLSYARYAESLLAHLWPGSTERDVILATSRTAQGVLHEWFAALTEGYGLDARRFAPPRVARVPLGVDPACMAPASPEERAALRSERNMAEGTLVVLVFGRISHFSKMDVLPVLRAVQRLFAAGTDRAAVRLELAGYVRPGERHYRTLEELARNMGLAFHVTPSPDEAEKRALFACADVFLSPVDNVQETFGLAVLEAGLMGLPTIASDYDGYRDLVEHGVTGLLLPTLAPARTPDVDLLSRVWFDNQYHLLLAQRTAVDVPSMAAALARLLAAPEERRAMGRAARERVLAAFTWEHVVRACQREWEAAWERPVDAALLRDVAHPLHVPYGRVFGGYVSQPVGEGAVDSGRHDARSRAERSTADGDGARRNPPVVRSRAGDAVYRGQEHLLIYAGIDTVVDERAVRAALVLARRPLGAVDLAARLAENEEFGLNADAALVLVLWCLKHDLLELAGQGGKDATGGREARDAREAAGEKTGTGKSDA